MEYSKFSSLIKKKENQYIDFKLECHAFADRTIKSNAELAKDVCAMANNGNIASYLIIGVNDKGTAFRSVTNDKITEDNVVNFLTKAVFPPPKIKVYKEKWNNCRTEHKDTSFVIIQIGPQKRQAFRLNQDFIDYKNKVYFRRNEVWIRRNATSDLATPEEVALLCQGKNPVGVICDYTNIEYTRLSRKEKIKKMMEDLQVTLNEMGSNFIGPNQLKFKIKKFSCILRLIAFEESKDWQWVDAIANREWSYEHGFIIPVMSNITKKMIPSYAEIAFKEKWGWFVVLKGNYSMRFSKLVPLNFKEFSTVYLFLSNIKTTKDLRKNFLDMISFLEEHDEFKSYLKENKVYINNSLRKCLKEGWHFKSRKAHYISPPDPDWLKEDEYYDKKEKIIKKINNNESYRSLAKFILNS